MLQLPFHTPTHSHHHLLISGRTHSHILSPSNDCGAKVPFDVEFWDRTSDPQICGCEALSTDKTSVCFPLAVFRLGFPMMIMTCMIGMCYLLATHIGLGWNM